MQRGICETHSTRRARQDTEPVGRPDMSHTKKAKKNTSDEEGREMGFPKH